MEQRRVDEAGFFDKATDKYNTAWPPQTPYSEFICAWLNAAIDSQVEIYFNDGAEVYRVARVNPFGSKQLQVVFSRDKYVVSITCMWDHPFLMVLAPSLEVWNKEVK